MNLFNYGDCVIDLYTRSTLLLAHKTGNIGAGVIGPCGHRYVIIHLNFMVLSSSLPIVLGTIERMRDKSSKHISKVISTFVF
jgi:hypothetical protein